MRVVCSVIRYGTAGGRAGETTDFLMVIFCFTATDTRYRWLGSLFERAVIFVCIGVSFCIMCQIATSEQYRLSSAYGQLLSLWLNDVPSVVVTVQPSVGQLNRLIGGCRAGTGIGSSAHAVVGAALPP